MYDRSYPTADGQLRNVHYDNDIHYTLQMCEWLLKLVGVWPLVNSHTRSKLQQLLSTVLISTCFSSILFIILPSFHHIFFVEKNTDMKVKLIGPVSFCVTSAIKYCYLGTKGHSFERCIQHVRKDWKTVHDQNYRTIMLKYATISRKLITVCAAFLYSGALLYYTVMQFLSKEKSGENNTFRPLAYPGPDSILDSQSSPTYEIVFSIHCFTGLIMCSITMLAYSLAATFVTHICGQIQIQIARLQNLVKSEKREDSGRDPLSIIVHDHVKTLRFSKNAEEALREICLAQIVESTVVMCFLEYYCMVELRNSDAIAIITYVILFISFTFNIFIFCYIGEVLTEQCGQIGINSYKIKWYNLPAKNAHDLILLISISQYPPRLTAGKIFELSLNTFSSIGWYNLPAKDAYDLIPLVSISQYPPKLTAGKIIELSFDTFSSIGWYNLPAKDAYDLIPLVSISQYPPKLTAGKIIELSFDTFSSVTKTSLVYLNLLQTLTDCGGMSYHTVVQFLSKDRRGKNYTFKPLTYPGYESFLDTQSSPTYEIVFFLHCFAAMIMYSVTTVAYSLGAIFVTHICGQIQIQIARLHDLVKSKEREDGERDPLSVIVHDHVEILRQIGKNSYEIEWYNLPSKNAYDLILLISMSQYPPRLTAGKIIELSLNTFSSVAKTSLIYLNLLRTVTDW
ncbi:Putative odorant receptor 13a [Melipona quadrifasciata]|uniref:Putative odorant receptor 13a n=1 Tax=Melipona quadrifasciata TaxID=166423 RepID=A0A0N0BFR3_9HYME|nr:Putative odorant receptor 13a [Melipona quadrifasciata]